VVNLAVTDAKEQTIEVRCLASAGTAGQVFDLRCEVREKMIDFLQREHPSALPRQRAELAVDKDSANLRIVAGDGAHHVEPPRELKAGRN
jgi:hypothetical protein